VIFDEPAVEKDGFIRSILFISKGVDMVKLIPKKRVMLYSMGIIDIIVL